MCWGTDVSSSLLPAFLIPCKNYSYFAQNYIIAAEVWLIGRNVSTMFHVVFPCQSHNDRKRKPCEFGIILRGAVISEINT